MNDDDDRALDGGDGDDDNANNDDDDDYDEEEDDIGKSWNQRSPLLGDPLQLLALQMLPQDIF